MEKSNPKVSVLMTVYNSERYLADAIESVLQQTMGDFELVILDDCSTDSSWDIIQKFSRQDERIKAVRNEKNLGGCENLNKGLRMLRGEYMARHDNDDWSYPDRLEKQVNFLDTHAEVGIVGGTIELIDTHGVVLGKRSYNLSDAEIRRKIFRYSPFAHPLVMVRKSILDKVGGSYDVTFAPADDYDLWFRIGKESQFANLPDTLLKYRLIPESITFSATKKMERMTIKVRNKFTKDKTYPSGLIDRMYNYLHYVSIGVVPSKLKIALYNYFRNNKPSFPLSKIIPERVLITGGGSGLGAVIAERLRKRGYIVYCTSRENRAIEDESNHFFKMDVTSDTDVERVVSELMSQGKHIDVLINNAGITLSGPALGFSAEDFRRILDTNVIGSFRLIRAMTQKPRLIINITSLNGFLVFPNFGIYSASKFAAEALGRALRYELGPDTQVTNVAPGALLAESSERTPHKTVREKIPFLNWLIPLTSQVDVARKIEKLLQSRKVPSRVLIGRDTWVIYLMQKFLPNFFFDWIVMLVWKKK